MKDVSSILLAGGTGSRLFPNTKIVNKHLLPIYDKPMIYYSLSIPMLAGIRDITIVCNTHDLESFKNLLGNGEQFGVSIDYSLQDNPDGIPHAIKVALDNLSSDKYLVTLGDNFIFGGEFFSTLKNVVQDKNEIAIFTQAVKNPENFGVVLKDSEGKISKFVEKPSKHISNNAVIGLYLIDQNFVDHFENIKKSARGETEIVDIFQQYGLESISSYELGRGTAWFDMGTVNSFYNSSSFVKTIQERQGLLICSPHEIAFRNSWITENDLKKYLDSLKDSEYAENLNLILS
ncbi:sugar phosphate nucleotidyltransferase [Acidimicrobiia bacterium]|nr:sugar phosphate nucleotidyltransferase [Acidimicrobiia bacterium]